MSAAQLAVLPAPLYYHHLQQQPIKILRRIASFRSKVTLNQDSQDEMHRWISHLQQWNGREITPSAPDLIVQLDASLQGWGAVYNRRPLISSREDSIHQPLGTPGRILCNRGLHQAKEQSPGTTTDGQPLHSRICEQDGWHTLSNPFPLGLPVVAMVPPEKDRPVCRISPRSHKHYSGSGVPSGGVTSRMDGPQ